MISSLKFLMVFSQAVWLKDSVNDTAKKFVYCHHISGLRYNFRRVRISDEKNNNLMVLMLFMIVKTLDF